MSLKAQAKLRALLKKRMDHRKAANPRFSMRAEADRLQISPTTLSLFLSGKRRLSTHLALKIAHTLPNEWEEKTQLLNQIERKPALASQPPTKLTLRWRHLLVLTHLQTRLNSFSCGEVKSTLSIRLKAPENEIDTVLSDLKAVGFIVERENRFFVCVPDANWEQRGSISIREMNREILKFALHKMDRLDDPSVYTTTDFTSVTMHGSPEQFHLVKEKIARFQSEISEILESGEGSSTAYTLAVQFFEA